jgi:hypothetical protein
MTDAPEKIWVEPDGETLIIHNGSSDLEALIATGCLHEYTRTDVADARIKELEKELGHCIYELNRADSRKPHRDRRAGLARKAMKGEDK